MPVFGGEVIWEVVGAHIDFLLPIVVLSALNLILVVSVSETVILPVPLLCCPLLVSRFPSSCLQNAWGCDSPPFFPLHSHIAALSVEVCTADGLFFFLLVAIFFSRVFFGGHGDLMLDRGFVVRRVVLDVLLVIVGTCSWTIYVYIPSTVGSC